MNRDRMRLLLTPLRNDRSMPLRMKKNIFFIFFSCNLPAGTLSLVFKAKRGRNGSKKPKT